MHQQLGPTCQDGRLGGPFVLMDDERARELLIERAKDSPPRGDAESPTNHYAHDPSVCELCDPGYDGQPNEYRGAV